MLVCGAFGPDRDLSHEDPDVRRGAGEYLNTCIDIAAAVGSANVSGPMYSATGKTRLLSDTERRQEITRRLALAKAASIHVLDAQLLGRRDLETG